jgi:hypothetical protein
VLPVRLILGSTLLLASVTASAATPWWEESSSAAAATAESARAKNAASTRVKLKTTRSARLVETYDRLPLAFEANRGQTDRQVKFLARGPGYTLFLTGEEAVLALRGERQESPVKGQKTNADQAFAASLVTCPSTSLGAVSLSKGRSSLAPAIVRLKLVGGDSNAKVVGLDELPGKSNYFLGNDPTEWRANVPNYGKVKYEGVYPGIDLVYYGNQRRLEYDFVVAPGADPRAIRFAVETGNSKLEAGKWEAKDRNSKSATYPSPADPESSSPNPAGIHIDMNGDLVIAAEGGEVRFHKPRVYQEQPAVGSRQSAEAAHYGQGIAGGRRYVDGRYVLHSTNPKSKIENPEYEVSFELASYDPSLPLIIDPALSFSTYLGGANGEIGYGIAVDADGNVYVAGSTGSVDFPTASPLQSATVGDFDAFVSKLDPTGTALVYSTYLGGTGFDRATGIALDASGNAYVTGMTASNNFPTTANAFQTTFGGGTCGTSFCSDAFVAEVKADGSALVYSTYLGGSDADFGQGIAVDNAGSAYVTGSTLSANFPTASPLQAAGGGNSDAFVTKLNPDGTALAYSTFLGGADGDFGQAIAVNAAGNAFVAGYTFSTNLVTVSPLQNANAGSADAFVVELDPPGTAMVYSTYLGGSGLDRAAAIAVDGSGNAYVAGDTNSPDFPLTAGALQSVTGGGTCGSSPCSDAFVAKLGPGGSPLVYATYLGGTDIDQAAGVAVDAVGNAVVTGFTRSDDFPLASPLQAAFGGGTCDLAPCSDAFITEINPAGTAAVYSTYLGGNDTDFGQAVALDAAGNAYVTGSTASANYPVILGAVQVARGGNAPTGDAFVAKISPADAPAVAMSPQALTFADQSTGFTSDAQTLTLTNSGSAPLTIASVVAHGDFAQANTCGTSVAAGGATCTISVTFTPTDIGDRTGDVTITDNAPGSPHVIALAGEGVTPAPAVTLSPTSLAFPDQAYNTTSSPLTATLTNSGTAALTITAFAVSGDFGQTNDCPLSPTTLAVGAHCVISVTFTPAGTGALSGAVSISDDGSNATGGNHTLTLSGNGIPVFSLSADKTSQTVTRGTDAATFTITATGPSDFTGDITLSCPSTGGATCTFNPTSIKVGGTSTLTLGSLSLVTAASQVITLNGVNGTQTAALDLTIQFADFALGVSPTFATVVSGDSTTFTLTVTPSNGFTGSVSFSCSGLPQETTCTFSPTNVDLKDSAPVTTVVTVKTTIRVTSLTPPRPLGPPRPWLLVGIIGAALVSLVLLARRQSPARLVLAATVLTFTLFLASCGQDYFTFTGTPPGTFAISLNATVGNVTHSTGVALTVQ